MDTCLSVAQFREIWTWRVELFYADSIIDAQDDLISLYRSQQHDIDAMLNSQQRQIEIQGMRVQYANELANQHAEISQYWMRQAENRSKMQNILIGVSLAMAGVLLIK